MSFLLRAAQSSGSRIPGAAYQAFNKPTRFTHTPYFRSAAHFSSRSEGESNSTIDIYLKAAAVFAILTGTFATIELLSPLKKSKELENQLTSLKIRLVEKELHPNAEIQTDAIASHLFNILSEKNCLFSIEKLKIRQGILKKLASLDESPCIVSAEEFLGYSSFPLAFQMKERLANTIFLINRNSVLVAQKDKEQYIWKNHS